MDRSARSVIVGNAVIRASVLPAAAYAHPGTDCFSQVSLVLGGGAVASVIVVGGGVRRLDAG